MDSLLGANFVSQGQQWVNQSQGGFWNALLGATTGVGHLLAQGPDSEGWHDYSVNPPPPYALCQFKQGREENEGEPWVGYQKDFRPEFNVAYLKWRYTGIAKEERGI